MDKIYLPQHLIPKNKTTLFRCGSYNDGGYLLNKNDVLKSDTLISLGIHENWDFKKIVYEPIRKGIDWILWIYPIEYGKTRRQLEDRDGK